MSITIEQHAELQPVILEMQRIALRFAELGESKISGLVMQATVRAQRVKPSKPQAVAPTKAEKGKGA